MCLHTQRITSKINLINGLIGQYHDSGLFSPSESSQLTAPLVVTVNELQQKLQEIKAKDYEVIGEEVLTPQTNL